jgi:hypothetical protein
MIQSARGAFDLLLRAVLLAVLATVFAGLGPRGPALAAKDDVWTLQDIRINTEQLYRSATVISKRLDGKGGFLEFQLSGDDMLSSCPGGSEQVRFSWDFFGDVSQLLEGSDVQLGLHGELLHITPPCGGAIAADARMTAIGSKGGSPAVSEEQMKITDGDRFYTGPDTIATRFAFGTDDGGALTNTTRIIRLDVYDHSSIRPYAYFVLQVGFRGAGVLQVIYLYKSGTDTPFKPPVVTGDGSACGFTLGSGILAKWQEFGGQAGFLGCATGNEDEAARSPAGTTGRYGTFTGGVIIWHRDGPLAGRSFAVHGCIGATYQGLGGTGSWLGMPVSDEIDVPGGRRGDFEGGYILWNPATGGCTAHRDGSLEFTLEPNTNRPGLDFRDFDLIQEVPELCRDACAADGMCVAYTYVKGGVQGPKARCWLKSVAPAPVPHDCCVSGVRH